MHKTVSDIYREYEEAQCAKKLKERDAVLDRRENFEREQLTMKLKSIDKLSDSISMLATSISQQDLTHSSSINIYIDKDTSPENLEMILNRVNN